MTDASEPRFTDQIPQGWICRKRQDLIILMYKQEYIHYGDCESLSKR